MSVRTMSLVFEYDMPELKTDDDKTVPDSTAKFVLLALADHCNDEGEGAYPGVKRICKKTSMSSQTVCNALNALRTNGYTTLQEKPSKAGTNNYTVNIDKLSQPLGFQPLESDDSNCQNSKIPAARVKPSNNHQSNHEEKEDIDISLSPTDPLENEVEKIKYDTIIFQFSPNTRAYFEKFYELTKLLPVGKKQLKEWLDACSNLWSARVYVEDMDAALNAMLEKDYTVKNPGSLLTAMQTIKLRREKNVTVKPAFNGKQPQRNNDPHKYVTGAYSQFLAED
jgi:hypothetical protein